MTNHIEQASQTTYPEEDPVIVGVATHELFRHPAVMLPLEFQIAAAIGGALLERAVEPIEEKELLV